MGTKWQRDGNMEKKRGEIIKETRESEKKDEEEGKEKEKDDDIFSICH